MLQHTTARCLAGSSPLQHLHTTARCKPATSRAELRRYAPSCNVAQVGARGRVLHDFCVRVAAPALSALAPAHCPFRAQPLEPGRHGGTHGVRTGVLTGVRTGVGTCARGCSRGHSRGYSWGYARGYLMQSMPTGYHGGTHLHTPISFVAGAHGPPKGHARGHSGVLCRRAGLGDGRRQLARVRIYKGERRGTARCDA